jgi:hypothetical protein
LSADVVPVAAPVLAPDVVPLAGVTVRDVAVVAVEVVLATVLDAEVVETDDRAGLVLVLVKPLLVDEVPADEVGEGDVKVET